MPWPWVAALVGLLGAGASWALLRRRRTAPPEVTFEPPAIQAKSPASSPAPRPDPAEAAPVPHAALTLDLAAARMSATLVNASLSYRLVLSASAQAHDVVIVGGMTAAHASRPTQDQLDPRNAPELHTLRSIGAGEIIEVAGEIRLPLAEITPIRHGNAALFVPLVRLEVTATVDGRPFTMRAAFVVGLEEGAAGQRLQPFRLDLGPRIYPKISQRALTVPAFA